MAAQQYVDSHLTEGGAFTEEVCPMCYDEWNETANEIVKTECGHAFHKECAIAWFSTALPNGTLANTCPSCRAVCFTDFDVIHERERVMPVLREQIMLLLRSYFPYRDVFHYHSLGDDFIVNRYVQLANRLMLRIVNLQDDSLRDQNEDNLNAFWRILSPYFADIYNRWLLCTIPE
jgi:hypothetical protein